jgi:hypothetical protein
MPGLAAAAASLSTSPRHCSRTTRAACRGARREKLYDYYGISYDATERGAAWTPAEDLGTTMGAATTGGHPDRPDDAPTTTGR